jgi:hypothetical protein
LTFSGATMPPMAPFCDVRSTRSPWISELAALAATMLPSERSVTRPLPSSALPPAVTRPTFSVPTVCSTLTLPCAAAASSLPPLTATAMAFAGSLPSAPPTLPVALSTMSLPVTSAVSLSCTIERPAGDTPATGVTPLPALTVVVPLLLRISPLSSTSAAELTVTVPLS